MVGDHTNLLYDSTSKNYEITSSRELNSHNILNELNVIQTKTAMHTRPSHENINCSRFYNTVTNSNLLRNDII